MAERIEYVSAEEFQQMIEIGIIDDNGKMTDVGGGLVFGEGEKQEIVYKIGEPPQPAA